MKKGKFNILVDSSWGSSGKSAASTRLADIYNTENASSCNYANAGHCQTGDNYILTNNGLKKLGDVINSKIDSHSINMLGKLEPIIDFVNDGIRQTNHINLDNGITMKCTSVHKYYVWDSFVGSKAWVESRYLDKNIHQFLFPKNVNYDCEFNFNDFEDKKITANKTIITYPKDEINFAKYLGLIIGNGDYCGNRVRIAINIKQVDTIDIIKKLYRDIGITNYVIKLHSMSNECYTIECNQVSGLFRLFEHVGMKRSKKDNKTTPEYILKSNKKIIAAYLSGLFETDGCAKSDRVTFSSCAMGVVTDMQQLLYILGIHSCITVYKDKRILKSGNYRKNQWTLSISGKRNMISFKEKVGFISEYKNQRLKLAIDNTKDSGQIIKLNKDIRNKIPIFGKRKKENKGIRVSFVLSKFMELHNMDAVMDLVDTCKNYHIVNIKNIILNAKKERVYDITMGNTHSYISNGTISHNTVVFGDDKFVFKSLPGPAVLNRHNKSVTSWIGPNSGFFIEQFKKEVDYTNSIENKNLYIHNRAVIMDNRHALMEAPGGSQSTLHISSTMSGSGAAFSEKSMRKPETIIAKNIGIGINNWDFYNKIWEELELGRSFIHEVSQGFALSINSGTHWPHSTFREATPQQACADFGIKSNQIGDIYLNCRSFPIRVGDNFDINGNKIGYSGDTMHDSIELTWEEIGYNAGMPEEEVKILAEKERTTVTRKIRKAYTPSWELLKFSAKFCGATKLILNFPQYIAYSSYRVRGARKEFLQLDEKIRAYVDKMEDTTNLPVVMIGTSADHNDYIWLE